MAIADEDERDGVLLLLGVQRRHDEAPDLPHHHAAGRAPGRPTSRSGSGCRSASRGPSDTRQAVRRCGPSSRRLPLHRFVVRPARIMSSTGSYQMTMTSIPTPIAQRRPDDPDPQLGQVLGEGQLLVGSLDAGRRATAVRELHAVASSASARGRPAADGLGTERPKRVGDRRRRGTAPASRLTGSAAQTRAARRRRLGDVTVGVQLAAARRPTWPAQRCSAAPWPAPRRRSGCPWSARR